MLDDRLAGGRLDDEVDGGGDKALAARGRLSSAPEAVPHAVAVAEVEVDDVAGVRAGARGAGARHVAAAVDVAGVVRYPGAVDDVSAQLADVVGPHAVGVAEIDVDVAILVAGALGAVVPGARAFAAVQKLDYIESVVKKIIDNYSNQASLSLECVNKIFEEPRKK